MIEKFIFNLKNPEMLEFFTVTEERNYYIRYIHTYVEKGKQYINPSQPRQHRHRRTDRNKCWENTIPT